MSRRRVAIFTTFFEAESGYSLIMVAETQIRMFLDHYYDPVVLVQDDFRVPAMPTVWDRTMVDLRPVIPSLGIVLDKMDSFQDKVDAVVKSLHVGLQGIDVCITHDIILQDFYVAHNVAMREYARSRPDILWLHWIHSVPTPSDVKKYPDNCRYKSPPGYIVYPNHHNVPKVKQTYNLNGSDKVVVSRSAHSIDPFRAFKYDPLTVSLAKASGLLDGDVSAVYPARLDRGKQPEKIIMLMKGIKECGYEPRLLIIDWQSAGDRFQRYIEELFDIADYLGIRDCINFTSRLDNRCSQGVPHHVVTELMDLSTVYVHPSMVETYGLTTHEAALRGKLLVLNADLPVAGELFEENAIYMAFSSDENSRRKYKPTEQNYWNEQATKLMVELIGNRALWAQSFARRNWTPDAMWEDFEKLLYLTPVGE